MVIFFVLGFLSVLVPNSTSDLTSSSTNTPLVFDPLRSTPTADSNLISLLVLGVDSMAVPSPRLLATWWITFSQADNRIVVLGLPSNAAYSQQDARTISQEFDISPVTGPSQDFLTYLSSLSSLQTEVVVVLDEVAFAALIDFMGGAWMDGSFFDGQSIVAALDFVQDDPELALSMQASLLISLSFQVEQLGDSPEITSLTDLAPDHAYISIPPTTLVNMIIPLLPIRADNVQIQVWTPEIVSQSAPN